MLNINAIVKTTSDSRFRFVMERQFKSLQWSPSSKQTWRVYNITLLLTSFEDSCFHPYPEKSDRLQVKMAFFFQLWRHTDYS